MLKVNDALCDNNGLTSCVAFYYKAHRHTMSNKLSTSKAYYNQCQRRFLLADSCQETNDRTSAGERGGSVVECRTPEREVRGSRPTAAVLCP